MTMWAEVTREEPAFSLAASPTEVIGPVAVSVA
jgi:hypothetical protein